MTNWWYGLLRLILQGNCPLCDRTAEDLLCSSCLGKLEDCRHPHPYQQGKYFGVLRWGRYDGVLKRAIATMKYENHPELAELLGDELGQLWLSTTTRPLPKMTVVPLPMNPQKRAKRGFDQAELIARSFCDRTKLPCKPQGLLRARETQALFELNPQERKETLKNAFSLGKDFQKRLPRSPILLIDDIYTTGATVQEARRTLKRHQIQVAGVAVVATPQANMKSKTQSGKK
ncbi:ComF family protein [Spirulina sp. CS-785/01]|uniref:ComF family protein n=1 Tax=Spirulina sp. CS-785/01 TaxID=3021716 RepID=UPI0023312F6F|nr:ComF family protein [Spirulina sp. CS-785/01]MDB9315157.1 ComF family protein [Spirulina sp. CS-785/01]